MPERFGVSRQASGGRGEAARRGSRRGRPPALAARDLEVMQPLRHRARSRASQTPTRVFAQGTPWAHGPARRCTGRSASTMFPS